MSRDEFITKQNLILNDGLRTCVRRIAEEVDVSFLAPHNTLHTIMKTQEAIRERLAAALAAGKICMTRGRTLGKPEYFAAFVLIMRHVADDSLDKLVRWEQVLDSDYIDWKLNNDNVDENGEHELTQCACSQKIGRLCSMIFGGGAYVIVVGDTCVTKTLIEGDSRAAELRRLRRAEDARRKALRDEAAERKRDPEGYRRRKEAEERRERRVAEARRREQEKLRKREEERRAEEARYKHCEECGKRILTKEGVYVMNTPQNSWRKLCRRHYAMKKAREEGRPVRSWGGRWRFKN